MTERGPAEPETRGQTPATPLLAVPPGAKPGVGMGHRPQGRIFMRNTTTSASKPGVGLERTGDLDSGGDRPRLPPARFPCR